VGIQLFVAYPTCVVGVRAGLEAAASDFAEKIDEHIVIANARILFLGRSRLKNNFVQNFDDRQDFDRETGLFEDFPTDAGLEGFAKFERASGERPLPYQRFAAPANQ